MADWTSAEEPVLRGATELAAELADPIRLTVLQLLAHEGPHGGTQLADVLGLAQPRLANHLRRLRDAGLVTVDRDGRHATYRLTDPGLVPVLDALAVFAGGTLPVPEAGEPVSRLCYDHLAGRWAVDLADLLVRGEALVPTERDHLEPGPGAGTASAWLGLDLAGLPVQRRVYATRCLDRSLRRPHLGGALGAAVAERAVQAGWVRPTSDREVSVTRRGARLLASSPFRQR